MVEEKTFTRDTSAAANPMARLLAFRRTESAGKAGCNSDALGQILWLIHANNRLPGFIHIAENLLVLCRYAAKSKDPAIDQAMVARWIDELRWIRRHAKNLPSILFRAEEEDLQEQFRREKGRNPVLGCATEHGLYRLLWERHPNRDFQRAFRWLQGGALLAHTAIMAYSISPTDWESGAAPGHNLYRILYQRSLAVLRFLDGDSVREYVLRTLPLTEEQAMLPNRLRDIVDSIHEYRRVPLDSTININETHDDLISIATFIEWGFAPQDHDWTERNRDSNSGDNISISLSPHRYARRPGTSGSSTTLKSPVKKPSPEIFEIECPDDDEEIEDQDNADGEPSLSLSSITRREKKPELERQIRQAGDLPSECAPETPLDLAADETGVAIAVAGWQEMNNQLLPWSWKTLTIGELATILITSRKAVTEGDPDALKNFAIINLLLWTGQSLARVLSLQVSSTIPAKPQFELGLAMEAKLSENSKHPAWLVRAMTDHCAKDDGSPNPRARSRIKYITLPDYAGGSAAIQALLDAQGRALPAENPVLLLDDPTKDIEARLNKSLNEMDLQGRVTINRISAVLFQRILDRSADNISAASLITNQAPPLASAKLFYSTPSISSLQLIYRDAVLSLKSDLARTGYQLESPDFSEVSPGSFAVGSALCPAMKTVKEAIGRLKAQVLECKDGNGPIIFRHNIYTLYSALYLQFAVGFRGICNPWLSLDQIDFESGIASVQDKGDESGYKTRLLYLPQLVRDQIRNYAQYREYSEFNVLKNQNPPLSCYFVDDDRMAIPLTHSVLEERMKDYLPFPANVGRHFMRTELVERGTPTEIVDTWMGHASRGEEQWGKHSCFSYQEYIRVLDARLVPLLNELGFESINYLGVRIADDQ
jgi:hypothetical protein